MILVEKTQGLKVGSKEWLERLNGAVTFPEKFAFYYNKRENIIQIGVVRSKGKVEKIRWSAVKPSPLLFHPEDLTALVAVKNVESDEEYTELVLKYQKLWCK